MTTPLSHQTEPSGLQSHFKTLSACTTARFCVLTLVVILWFRSRDLPGKKTYWHRPQIAFCHKAAKVGQQTISLGDKAAAANQSKETSLEDKAAAAKQKEPQNRNHEGRQAWETREISEISNQQPCRWEFQEIFNMMHGMRWKRVSK